jgi:hypothetical protein
MTYTTNYNIKKRGGEPPPHFLHTEVYYITFSLPWQAVLALVYSAFQFVFG